MLSLSQLQILPPKNWQDFESLCHELFRAEWGDFFAQKHARPGKAQDGVDLYGIPAKGLGYAGVQCKCPDLRVRNSLTPTQLRREIAKARRFTPSLKQYVIATPLPRDPELQRVAREITTQHRRRHLFPVHVLSWDDLTTMLDNHPHIATRYFGSAVAGSSSVPEVSASCALPIGSAILKGDSSTRASSKRQSPVIFPPHTYHAIGIIATSPIPMLVQWLTQFFPNVSWPDEIKTLVNAGIVIQSKESLHVPDKLTQSFLAHEGDRHRYIREWVDVLQPLRAHVDTAMLLSIQQLRLGDKRAAVVTLVDTAYNLEAGYWNETYRKTLLSCDLPKILRLLGRDERADFLNVLGLCHARSGKPFDAVPFFRRLRGYSQRVGIAWGVGQSYINEGFARAEAGQPEKAMALYRHAVTHAKKHRDHQLLGRSLHNLVMLTSEYDPAEAERLLADSITARRAANDSPNGPAPLFCRGLLAAKRGDPRNAIKWFTKAEEAAVRLDQRDARCTSLCNIAKAHLDLGSPRKALPAFKAARKLSEQEGFEKFLILALGGEAYARHLLGQHAIAAPLFRRRYELLIRYGQYTDAAIAIHDTAVMLARAGDPSATRVFREALAFARKRGIDNWVYQCHRDAAFLANAKSGTAVALKLLRKAIKNEEAADNRTVAARLHQDVIQVLTQHEAPPQEIETAFSTGFAMWRKATGSDRQICDLRNLFFSWLWSTGRFSAAIATLRTLATSASLHGLSEYECEAFDQMGVCLQQLGAFEEAEDAHRRAVRAARSARDEGLLENALNNLGELLRCTGRPREALKPLCQAESLASRRGDGEAVVSIAHNRAIALFAAGQHKAAQHLLRNCRDRALRYDWREQFVRAEHGLANFAWERRRPREAEQLYRRALRNAARYGITDQVWQLSLNYSNVLRWKKQPKRALWYCQAAAKSCEDPVDRYHCLQQTATCYEELENTTAAIREWRKYRAMAETARDSERIAIASASIAGIYATSGRFGKAEIEVKRALRHEKDPIDRIHLLYDYLEVLLAAKREKEASKVYYGIRRQVRVNSAAKDVLINAHLTIGHYKWSEGKKPVEALKAFVVALNDAYSIGMERALEVGAQFLRIFMALPRSERLLKLEDYENVLSKWLHRQGSASPSPAVLRGLLWPLRLAKRLTNEPAEGKRLSLQRLGVMIGEELGVKLSEESKG